MNTFHSFNTTTCTNIFDLRIFDQNQKISGFAIKLSSLNKLKLSISNLLEKTTKRIVIDAEYNRLDHWLSKELSASRITLSDLSQLILTVQVRRKDAADQLHSLSAYAQHGLQVLLVPGHQGYFDESRSDYRQSIVRWWEHPMVSMVGGSRKLLTDLRNNGLKISDNQYLELFGYHSLSTTSLWIYLTGSDHTEEVTSYLSRRKGHAEEFVLTPDSDTAWIRNNHLVVFIDTCCINHYLDVIEFMS